MPKQISEAQEAVFGLMRQGSFNSFDGYHVIEVLKKNRELWQGALFNNDHDNYLIALRDIEHTYNADTLYLLATEGKETALELLVHKEFEADEVDWIGGDQASKLLGEWSPRMKQDRIILRVWWD